MRIRPNTRLACAAVVCALAVGPGAVSSARAQSLVQALSTTYNSNPDLLAQRAVLRQTDETLAQAVANWRPRISLSLEYNKIEAELDPGRRRANRYLILNGRTSTLSITQPLFRGGKTMADTKTAQANIQAQRATLADTEQNVLLQAVTAYADLVRTSASSMCAGTTCWCWSSSSMPPANASGSASSPSPTCRRPKRASRGQGRPGAGRGAGAHRPGGLPARHRQYSPAGWAKCR